MRKILAFLLFSISSLHATTWYVSTSGSGSTCSIGSKCTLSEAYQNHALAGDTIDMAAGSYPIQTLTNKTLASDVTVVPSGGTVTIADLNLNGADHLYFLGGPAGCNFSLPSGGGGAGACTFVFNDVHIALGTTYITCKNCTVDDGFINAVGGNNISFIGGAIGNTFSNSKSQLAPVAGWQGEGQSWLFDGVYFHDVRCPGDDCVTGDIHLECMQVVGMTNMIIRNSKFRRCAIFDLSFTEYNSSGKNVNLLLENNWFDTALSGGFFAVNLTQMNGGKAWYNSSTQAWDIQGSNVGTFTFLGNNVIAGLLDGNTGGCNGGTAYSYNVTQGVKCGATDVNASPGFVNTDGFDLHLNAGSSAIDLVPTASGYPSTDIDGNARPVGPKPDAGASEFGGSGGGGDTTPPTVSLTAPANGATVTGAAVPLSASCTDNISVFGVQFKIDNVNTGSFVTSAPYAISWDSTSVGNGSHSVTALCTDGSGNSAQTGGATVTVSNASGGTRTAATVGTPFGARTTTAATTLAIPTTSFSSGQALAFWITADDNTSNNSTAVSSISIPTATFSIPCALKTRLPWSSTGTLDFELWTCRLSSAVTSQTITITFNASTRGSAIVFPFTGTDSSTPFGTATGALATGVTVANSAHSNSLYAFGLGCGDNTSRTVTAGTGYTLSGVEQGFSATNNWVHTAVEIKNAAVEPAANTAGSFTTACSNSITIGLEVIGPLTSVSAPSTPTGLAATAGNAQIIWTWNSAATAASYTLSVGASGGPYTDVFTGATLTYTQTGLTNGTQRCAKVLATNAGGDSALSSQVCATPTDPTPSPTAPTSLQASPGNASVVLNWTASGNSPTGYKVYRGTTSGGESLLATIGNVVTYTDSTASNATTYYYYVKGTNGTGDSAASSEVSATPTNCLIGNDLVPTSSSSFSSQAAYFSVVWDDILSTSVGNATSGVSSGAINSVADLAAAIRFGPTGFIEALNGANYTALNPVPWLTNTTYSFRLFIDVAGHKYNAYVTPPSGAEKIIANNYSFGTSSGSVSALNYMNVSRDLHQVCSYTVTTVYQTVTGSKAGSTVSGGTVK